MVIKSNLATGTCTLQALQAISGRRIDAYYILPSNVSPRQRLHLALRRIAAVLALLVFAAVYLTAGETQGFVAGFIFGWLPAGAFAWLAARMFVAVAYRLADGASGISRHQG